jgi:hypothetical protein
MRVAQFRRVTFIRLDRRAPSPSPLRGDERAPRGGSGWLGASLAPSRGRAAVRGASAPATVAARAACRYVQPWFPKKRRPTRAALPPSGRSSRRAGRGERAAARAAQPGRPPVAAVSRHARGGWRRVRLGTAADPAGVERRVVLVAALGVSAGRAAASNRAVRVSAPRLRRGRERGGHGICAPGRWRAVRLCRKSALAGRVWGRVCGLLGRAAGRLRCGRRWRGLLF